VRPPFPTAFQFWIFSRLNPWLSVSR